MHDNLKKILATLCNEWHYRLTAIELVDAHLCTDPSKYISMLLLSLNTMMHLELPHINVLSKVDLIRHYGKLGQSPRLLYTAAIANTCIPLCRFQPGFLHRGPRPVLPHKEHGDGTLLEEIQA